MGIIDWVRHITDHDIKSCSESKKQTRYQTWSQRGTNGIYVRA